MKIKTYRKNILLITCFVLFSISSYGQNFEWAKRAGGGAFDFGHAVCTDSAGNVYVTGEFEITAYFNSTALVSAGLHDIFVAKYNSAGNLLWVKRAGGPGGDVGYGISLDGAGNLYLTGEFEGTANFDGITLTAHSVVNEIFIAKYNSYGELQWVKNAGGTNTDKGFSISADAAGNSYLTGWFNNWAYFGNQTLVSYGGKDIFVAKYNTGGEFQWVKQAGDTLDDEGKGIIVDDFGNVYATGLFTDKALFESTTITSNGSRDIFIVKYNHSGNLQWVKNAGGSSSDAGRGITTDALGNIYVTGEFRSKSTFESIEIKSSGSADVFIACYDSLGNAIWVTNAGGNNSDGGKSIGVDKFSNIYISGQFSDVAAFGNATLTCTDSAGTTDAFIASYNKRGEFRWVKQAKGENETCGDGVSPDNQGNVYVTGYYHHTLYFDNFSLINSSDHKDIFVAKYNDVLFSEPTVPSSALGLMPKGCNKIKANWTGGNGEGHLVIVKAGSPVDIFPNDRSSYQADSAWSRGSDIGNGNYVVYDGKADSITVINLPPGQTYHFAVFEYNGSGFSANYLTTNYPTNSATTDSFNITVSKATFTICAGESVHLNASGASTYSWSPTYGLSDPNIPNPVASPDTTTLYTVKGTTNDCWNSLNVMVKVSCTGIVEMAGVHAVDIFPNPGKGEFTLQFSSDKRDLIKLKVIDMLGVTVYHEEIETNASDNYSMPLDLKHLSNGLYMLKMENKEASSLIKIVINK